MFWRDCGLALGVSCGMVSWFWLLCGFLIDLVFCRVDIIHVCGVLALASGLVVACCFRLFVWVVACMVFFVWLVN